MVKTLLVAVEALEELLRIHRLLEVEEPLSGEDWGGLVVVECDCYL